MVVDEALLESISNEQSINSSEFYPQALDIESVSYSGPGVTIKWVQESIPDFQSVDILRASDSLFTDQEVIADQCQL